MYFMSRINYYSQLFCQLFVILEVPEVLPSGKIRVYLQVHLLESIVN